MAPESGSPRTAIVTGGAKRIGAAIVRALAADGWHVLIHHNRSQAEAAALASATPGAAGAAVAARDGLPPARLLVNSASRFALDAAADFTVEGWDAHLDINL